MTSREYENEPAEHEAVSHADRVFHLEIDSAGGGEPPRRRDPGDRVLDQPAQTSVIDLVNELPWKDIEGVISMLDEALRRALEASGVAFRRWETEGRALGDSEFALGPADVDALSDDMRLAYAARHVRNIALMYGSLTEFGDGPLGEPDDRDRAAPGAILRRLAAIVEGARTRRQEDPPR